MQSKLPTEKVSRINHVEAGKRIRDQREKVGKSLRWLAHEMGKSPPYMSDLERGRRNWTPQLFDKATEILNAI